MQTTTMSWALEFLAGFILILTYILVEERDEFTDFMILLPVVFLNFILIPSSYLMILERYKQQIVEHGWLDSFRILVRNRNSVNPRILVRNRNSVNPSRNENLELQSINKSTLSVKKTRNKHIRTISGKIAERERHFENNK